MFIADSFRKETSPSMVYTLLKLVASKDCTKEDAERLISGNAIGDNSVATIRKVYKFAEDCELIKTDKDKVTALIDKKHLRTYADFVYALSREAFKVNNNFCKLTQWFLAEGISTTKLKADDLAVASANVAHVEKDDIYGWQDWMVAFGLATYTTKPSDNIMFDCHVRIKRFLQHEGLFKKGSTVQAKVFVSELVKNCPEFTKVINIKDNRIGESVSASLRILHNLGIIEILFSPDSFDIWHLTTSTAHKIKGDFTDIKVR